MPQFNIDQWLAWAPGLETAQQWADWSVAPSVAARSDAQPDVSFLPAMQRRRLSPLARMAFAVAWPLAEGQPPMPLVFVSRHGETPRNLQLLSDLARQEPLSPTQFSLSVHNAIIGLWSIMRGDSCEMTALAGDADGLEHGILEAAALLAEGAPQVLLIIAEDQQPAAYQPWINDVPFPYALALRLSSGQDWGLSLDHSAPGTPATWPHALNLLRALQGAASAPIHHCGGRQWTWRQQP